MSDTVTAPQLTSSDLANNQRAIAYFSEHGCNTVGTAFALARILHDDKCVAEASHVYRTAYDLHSEYPDQAPGPHVLLVLRLLCGMMAGQSPAEAELKTLRALSIPFYNYVTGIQAAWIQGDLIKAARIIKNCYEEFDTGSECDRLCLEVMNRLYHAKMENGIADSRISTAQIPRKIYMYRSREASAGVERNFEYHRNFTGLEIRIFNEEEAPEWLYSVCGVDARMLFFSARNASEASNIFRMHAIQQLGGWWLGTDSRIRSEDIFFSRLSQRHSHVFMLNDENGVHNEFFGSVAGSPVIEDALLSIYRNFYLHHDLAIAQKTGSGVLERALNRTFHADFERIRPMPSLITYGNATFHEVIEIASVRD
ncbi:hypothetical protein AOE01nite_03110 [Acetobacter oeni]|uniref:Uncharacterized protein n=2 Tax=Acetobacter oeni TaxID=304077 RepID=A0A511XGK5_9PROT|nr:hypothetical protein [Acetobacter oeni]GBR01899.1 hypothetical protein AA21952_0572 [Acetobacter oeni LMG 21952]GEN62087.1 hypothetical protein AOE01nite_03110 [Acetobacter oeni]